VGPALKDMAKEREILSTMPVVSSSKREARAALRYCGVLSSLTQTSFVPGLKYCLFRSRAMMMSTEVAEAVNIGASLKRNFFEMLREKLHPIESEYLIVV